MRITAKHRKDRKGRYLFNDLRDRVTALLLFAVLDTAVSFLFYRSFIAAFILLPAYIPFRREYMANLVKQKKQRMRQEFMTGMQLIGTALQAGYAIENTFAESLPELRRIYGEKAFITKAFEEIISKLSVRESVEKAMSELGEETEIEEIIAFAQVLRAVRRTGGDLMAIVRNTAADISGKEETRLEIETTLSGKQMEQKIMSIVPLLILGYTGLTSPSLMACMYHNTAGIVIMTVCLAVYVLAFLWGRRIMDIEV